MHWVRDVLLQLDLAKLFLGCGHGARAERDVATALFLLLLLQLVLYKTGLLLIRLLQWILLLLLVRLLGQVNLALLLHVVVELVHWGIASGVVMNLDVVVINMPFLFFLFCFLLPLSLLQLVGLQITSFFSSFLAPDCTNHCQEHNN